MKKIEISTAVFAAIWARRAEGEESEDAILARLLGLSTPARTLTHPTEKKMRWIDDVEAAFAELNGSASYHRLYSKVREIRSAAGRSLPPSTEAIIRREVENHSSDSEAYLGERDLFHAPEGLGAGIWAVRP